MGDWKKYRRKGQVEARPYVTGEDLTNISVSDVDMMFLSAGKQNGGMIARNEDNHEDQWYIDGNYFRKNYVTRDSDDESA